MLLYAQANELAGWAVVAIAVIGLVHLIVRGIIKVIGWNAKRKTRIDGSLSKENQWLRDKVDELTRRLDALERKYEESRTERHALRNEETALKLQNADQQRQINELKAENTRLHSEIAELRIRPSE